MNIHVCLSTEIVPVFPKKLILGYEIKEGLNVTKYKMLFVFEGNYGNLTFAHVIASNCSWIFVFTIIYLFGLVL